MKKSKVLVPALAVLAFSTAASITGTVAWFTATRMATFNAGTFAVVNTNTNLAYDLSNGIGVTVTGRDAAYDDDQYIANKDNYTLTDASLDITADNPNVVVPDDPREKVAHNIALGSLSEAAYNLREEGGSGASAYKILSAFAWDVTFKVTFPSTSQKNVGLFFNLTDSFARVAYKAKSGDKASDANWYTDTALSTGNLAAEASMVEGTTYYRATPQVGYTDASHPGSTGYGFRMAFVPKTVSGTSEGYGKVWSPFRNSSTGGAAKFIDGVAEGAALTTETSYTVNSVKMTNSARAAYAFTNNVVLMDASATQKDVPDNSAKTTATALTCENYLGMFACDPGHDVEMTFTCVVWYEGTDPSITKDATIFESVTTSLTFGVADLAAAA